MYNAVSGRYLDEGILKVAACYAYARTEPIIKAGTLYVESKDIKKAYLFVNFLLQKFVNSYQDLFHSHHDIVMKKLCLLYARNNCCPVVYRKLLWNVRSGLSQMESDELHTIINTLNDLGRLNVIEKPGRKGEWLEPNIEEVIKNYPEFKERIDEIQRFQAST